MISNAKIRKKTKEKRPKKKVFLSFSSLDFSLLSLVFRTEDHPRHKQD